MGTRERSAQGRGHQKGTYRKGHRLQEPVTAGEGTAQRRIPLRGCRSRVSTQGGQHRGPPEDMTQLQGRGQHRRGTLRRQGHRPAPHTGKPESLWQQVDLSAVQWDDHMVALQDSPSLLEALPALWLNCWKVLGLGVS